MAPPLKWLQASGAQGDVIEHLARYADWPTLWSECPRGDWLLGIAERLGAPHVALVRAALASARHVRADGIDEAEQLLDIVDRWLSGGAPAAEVESAARTLEAAMVRAVDPVCEAACRAALAVGLGVGDRMVLVTAPGAAAESVMMSSLDCGLELAMRWAHDKCASSVRDAIPWSLIATYVEAT